MDRNMFLEARASVFEKATALRNNETPSEQLLWEYLKLKPIGYKFRRQHPIRYYIADFYCHQLKLIIEADGKIHETEGVQHNDMERQSYLESVGITFLRFTNEEIEKDIETVKNKIETYLLASGIPPFNRKTK